MLLISKYSLLFILFICLLYINNVKSILKPESELTTHCYHFPAKDYGRTNNVKLTYGSSPKVLLNIGDQAIDFTLPTPEGKLMSLSDLLKEKSVVLLWGHYTCPAFQGLNSGIMFIGSSYEDEQLFIDQVKDKVTVVHLIGPEPHPLWPYTNFDSGQMKMNMWSTITQPQTFEERMRESVSRVIPLVHKEAIILVDYLDGKNALNNNPVWCSYANGARSAILIGQDGIVLDTQEWFNKDNLAKSVRKYIVENK